jgi:nitric oxide reductase NorD protein
MGFSRRRAPEDGDRAKLAGRFIYPEWDWKKGALVADQAGVLENIAAEPPQGSCSTPPRAVASCGDSVALYAFSSLRKERVFVDVCKSFDEPFGLRARIAALKPGFYTRLGAAMRHASFRLGERPNARKLLLVITDGKPNDLDHYEGRFGVEDTRRAAQEARRRGQAVFCVAIDAQAQSYLPHLFGPAGFSIVSKPEKLSSALPAIYRHLVG